MSTARVQLSEALREVLTDWQIVSDARVLDSVRKPGACVLWTSKRSRNPAGGTRWFTDEVVLWVLSAADAVALEDDLDALLLRVMEVLEPLAWANWTEAERGQLMERFEGYRLTVTCSFPIVDDTEDDNNEN